MSLSLQLDFVFLPVSLKFFLDFLQPLAQKERHKLYIHELLCLIFFNFIVIHYNEWIKLPHSPFPC